MLFMPDLEPVWIDWNHATEGGFRFIAKTDEQGEMLLGLAQLLPDGEMIEPPHYFMASSWFFTAILHLNENPIKPTLYRFSWRADEDVLTAKARPVPSHIYEAQARRVSWFDEIPRALF